MPPSFHPEQVSLRAADASQFSSEQALGGFAIQLSLALFPVYKLSMGPIAHTYRTKLNILSLSQALS